MLDDVIERLASFGYTVTEADSWVLTFVIEKVENHIKNSCNISSIPEGLHQMAVDMVVGEFLMGKKASGQLDESEIMNSEAVTSIKLGDTQVNFGDDRTASQQLDSLIAFLMKGYEADLASYRKMAW
jgi:hypothetical protein